MKQKQIKELNEQLNKIESNFISELNKKGYFFEIMKLINSQIFFSIPTKDTLCYASKEWDTKKMCYVGHNINGIEIRFKQSPYHYCYSCFYKKYIKNLGSFEKITDLIKEKLGNEFKIFEENKEEIEKHNVIEAL